MKNRALRILSGLASGVALLPLGTWIWFLMLTRNTFRLGEFTPREQTACILISLIPAVLYLVCARLRPDRRTWELLLPGLCYALTACGWILVLGTQWGIWVQAVALGSISQLHQVRLRTAALVCLGSALLPLGQLAWDSLRKGA